VRELRYGFARMSRTLRSAAPEDVPAIARLIRGLAEYERLGHEVVFREEDLRESLFGSRRYAEVVLAEEDGETVGFALFFHTFSTFLGKPGLYLEDLFVLPQHRGKGHGEALLRHLAKLTLDRGCGRFEWSVLDWNADAIRFYERIGAMAVTGWTRYRLTGEALGRLAGP
jgi:GNAT superfamily N-acetyltransferase